MLPRGSRLPVLHELDVVGGGYRTNSECPWCGSYDRERWYLLFITHYGALLHRPSKILHVAPSDNLRRFLSNQQHVTLYVTTDLMRDDVDMRFNITEIPFADEYFDVVICNHVLQDVPDDSQAMVEIARVLKRGGWALLQVPIALKLTATLDGSAIVDPNERNRRFGDPAHVRLYGRNYAEKLREAGFEVCLIEPTALLSRRQVEQYGIIARETIYLCRC